MGSTSDKITGHAKEGLGKLTDNKKMQAEGKAQQMKGKAKDVAQDVTDSLKRK